MKLRAIRADDKVQILVMAAGRAATLDNAGCVSAADFRGRSGESERERDSGSLSGQRDESAGSHRGTTEGAAQPGNHGNQEKMLLSSSAYFLRVYHSRGVSDVFLAVAGAPPEPADPHLPAAAVSSHVPPGHPVPRRPAEDHAEDAARDGGTLTALLPVGPVAQKRVQVSRTLRFSSLLCRRRRLS